MAKDTKMSLTDFRGFKNLFRSNLDYRKAYGSSMDSLFKIFTTNPGVSGMANYEYSLFGPSGAAPTGVRFNGADSSGLNPYGPYTLGEGLIYGQSRPTGINYRIEPNDVRAVGLKTPFTLVGWGFDKYGWPAPNDNLLWSSGSHFTNNRPSGNWASTGNTWATLGSYVPPSLYHAGPIDLRWDLERKVWTGAQSVYAGRITQVYRNNTILTATEVATTPYLADEITYDVTIFDGIANPVRVTGIRPVSSRPSDYKVFATPSGRSCILLHGQNSSAQPDLVMWVQELPGTIECNGISSDSSTIQSLSSAFGSDSVLYSELSASPLETSYGGTSFGSYTSGQILVGKTGNLLEKLKLTQGTGIQIYKNGTNVVFAINAGVSYNTSGVNTNITEIQGLTTPLSLAQGGTGASGKIFVDLTTPQAITASKSFSSGIYIGLAGSGINNIGFLGYYNTGFAAATGSTIKINNSGSTSLLISTTGFYFNLPGDISPLASGRPSLIVREGYNPNNYVRELTSWYDKYGNKMSYVTNEGQAQFCQLTVSGIMNSGYPAIFNLRMASGQVGNVINYNHTLNGTCFSVLASGDIVIGPTGFNTRIANSSGNKTIVLPTQSGTFAVTDNLHYRNFNATTGVLTLSTTHDVVECASGNYNIYLPLSTSLSGRVFTLKNNGSASVSIAASGSELINSTSVYPLGTGSSINLINKGNGWITY